MFAHSSLRTLLLHFAISNIQKSLDLRLKGHNFYFKMVRSRSICEFLCNFRGIFTFSHHDGKSTKRLLVKEALLNCGGTRMFSTP